MRGEGGRVATGRDRGGGSGRRRHGARAIAAALLLAAPDAGAALHALPALDPETARAIVAAGGEVELALHVPVPRGETGRAYAVLSGRGVDVTLEPAWQRTRQETLCPLGARALGEAPGWVRLRIDDASALERALTAPALRAPLGPPEIQVGETLVPTTVPLLPASWDAPTLDCGFAPGQPEARWLYGDWNGDGTREVGKYVPSLDQFLLDANGNGRWDGVAGGDRLGWVARILGPGEPLVGDWNGDGRESVGKALGARAYLDANESGGWEGVAGGDAFVQIAPGRPDAVTVVGDWDGDGRDQLGRFEPALPRYLLDLDGDGVWRGVAGGDRRVDFPPLDPGFVTVACEPFADDFEGTAGDGVGLGDDWRLLADLDEDGVFEDEAGGDLHLRFLPALELPPRPIEPVPAPQGVYTGGFVIRAIDWIDPD